MGNGGGGTNWAGGGYDPETHIFYAQADNSGIQGRSLRTPPPGFSDMRYVMGQKRPAVPSPLGAGRPGRRRLSRCTEGRGGGPARLEAHGIGGELSVQGLPILKPPYGVITAINLDRGDIQWQVPAGETPDNVRRNPALKGLDIPNTGQPGSAGVLVTKTLVIVGDNMVTSVTHPRGAMLRAYDKATGKEWARSGCRAAERLSHDLHVAGQAIYRDRGQRWNLQRRVYCVRAPRCGIDAAALPSWFLQRFGLLAQTPWRSTWDGVYTKAQADRGKTYTRQCLECHGDDLEGDPENPPLTRPRLFTMEFADAGRPFRAHPSRHAQRQSRHSDPAESRRTGGLSAEL